MPGLPQMRCVWGGGKQSKNARKSSSIVFGAEDIQDSLSQQGSKRQEDGGDSLPQRGGGGGNPPLTMGRKRKAKRVYYKRDVGASHNLIMRFCKKRRASHNKFCKKTASESVLWKNYVSYEQNTRLERLVCNTQTLNPKT